jgi:hypothetical protein
VSRAFRSVGAQLSLALLIVVAVALGVVYETVVPSLENRLIETRTSQLEEAGTSLALRVPGTPVDEQNFVENASASTNARVLLVSLLAAEPEPLLQVFRDSRGATLSEDIQSDPIAIRALLRERSESGTVERDVRVKILAADDQSWAAKATHARFPGKSCVIWFGAVAQRPTTDAQRRQENRSGVPVCDD